MASEISGNAPYGAKHGYDIKVIALRYSDSTVESSNEMRKKRQDRKDARNGMIRQDNEYNRMNDYIKILNDNITRYKLIIASNMLKSDTVDADVKNIISKVSAAMPKLFEQSASDVRSVSNALSAIIMCFEYYTGIKKELNTEHVDP